MVIRAPCLLGTPEYRSIISSGLMSFDGPEWSIKRHEGDNPLKDMRFLGPTKGMRFLGPSKNMKFWGPTKDMRIQAGKHKNGSI